MSTNLIQSEDQITGDLNSVVAGAGITIDNTDPRNPIITNSGGAGTGTVDTIVAGTGITVNSADPANPIVATTITQYTDEMAQDAVGTILTNSSSVTLVYSDATPSITATVVALGVTNAMLAGSITAVKLVGTDIATVGTITAGTWNGTPVTVPFGGTGGATFTSDALITGQGTSAFASLAIGTSNQLLGMNNAGNRHEYKTISTGSTAVGNDIGITFAANSVVVQVPDASATVRGALTTGVQSIAGVKSFTSIPEGPNSDPTTNNQLTRKSYVDALFVGLQVHTPVRIATTVAGTLASSFENGDTIDGIVLATGNRILIKNQASQSENGVYTVNASGAPTRATDYDTAAEIVPGSTFYVTAGTANAGTLWVENLVVVTVNTDPIAFGQVGSPTAYVFGVSQTNDGSNDFSVTTVGLNITYNLPTAGHGIRGAISGADWDTFSAKAGVSGSPTTGRLASWASASTLGDSGITVAITGGVTSSITIPISGTMATLAGTETFTNKTLTAPRIATIINGAATLSLPTTTDTIVGRATTDTLTNKSISGTTNTITNIDLTVSVTGVLPAANGGFVAPDVQIFNANGTWTKPAGSPIITQIIAVGGGGGGGSGRKGAVGTVRGGGGGGGPGGYAIQTFITSILGATETVVRGVGGAGASAVSVNSTNGANGTNGTGSSFGTWLRAGFGAAGTAGNAGSSAGGGGGTIWPPASSPSTVITGGGGSSTGGVGGTGSASFFTGSGGGAGGGVTTGNVAAAGGPGGAVGATNTVSGYATTIAGGAAGATSTNGGAGNPAPTSSTVGGSGGGGGGGSTSGTAGSGGIGGIYGGGGGGGGGSTDAVGNSGAGGTGGNGILIAITYY